MGGIACALLGGILLMSFCGGKLHNDTYVHEDMKIFDISQFFGYIGIAMFIFEGNGIVLNLNNEAKDKSKYPKLLVSAVITIILWYLTLSMICYSTYRGKTFDLIT